MKNLILALLLTVAMPIFSAGAEMTNGVFYADQPVECHLIAQSGASTTNQLSAGKTYVVENALVELEVAKKTTFYFAGGPMIEVGPNSTFSINLFDTEVKNLDSTPRKAEFGNHNLSLTFNRGEFAIVYPNRDSNSSFTLATPFSSYELGGGKYFVRLSDKSVIAFVLEGTLITHGDKNRTDKTEKGRLAVAIPFTDPSSGLADKIITSIKPLDAAEIERFASPILSAEKKWADVQFFVVGNRVIGIWMK